MNFFKQYRLSSISPTSKNPNFDKTHDPTPIDKIEFDRSPEPRLKEVLEHIPVETSAKYVHFFDDGNRYVGHCSIDALRSKRPHDGIYVIGFPGYSKYWSGTLIKRFYTSLSTMPYEFSQGMVYDERFGDFRTEAELCVYEISSALDKIKDNIDKRVLKTLDYRQRYQLVGRMIDLLLN